MLLMSTLIKANMQPTVSDIRKFNKQLVTRQLPLAQGCLHKFNPDSPPRINCDNCFFVWFNSNKERVEMFHNRYKNDKQGLIAEYGNNTVKQFNRFMATILKLREEKKESMGEKMY